jgi:hypothetical protein
MTKHLSDEHKAKISAANKLKSQTPETKAKRSLAAKKRFEDPVERAKLLKNRKAYTFTSEDKQRISIATKHAMTNPEVRKNISARKPRIITMETRAKLSASISKTTQTPEYRKKMSDIVKARYLNPDARLKTSIAVRKVMERPNNRANCMNFGEKNGRWEGGKSFEPYCPKWTQDLRRRIRAFFKYRCIICGKTTEENKELLSCHHVTYDKNACCDGKPVHFAALCRKCHIRTNSNRPRWEAIFHHIIDEIYDGHSYYTKKEMSELNHPS